MKNLVSSILFAAVASQAAGCIIVSDDTPPIDDLGAVRMTWALKSTNPAAAGNPDVTAQCPQGADTAILFALPQGADPSTAFFDQYDCVDGAGTVADLEPGTYVVWTQITDHPGTTKFAESGSQIVQVTSGGTATVANDIYVDRGFFFVGWNLTGRATTCSGITNGGVSILATDGGGAATGFEDLVDCAEGEGRQTISQPLPVRPALPNTTAQYTVAVALLNRANPPQSIGDAPVTPSRGFQNFGGATVDLGILNIAVR